MKLQHTIKKISIVGITVVAACGFFIKDASALSCITVVTPENEIADNFLEILENADRITKVSQVSTYASSPSGYVDRVKATVVASYKSEGEVSGGMDMEHGPWGTPIFVIAGDQYVVEEKGAYGYDQVEFGVCAKSVFPEEYEEYAVDYIKSLENYTPQISVTASLVDPEISTSKNEAVSAAVLRAVSEIEDQNMRALILQLLALFGVM